MKLISLYLLLPLSGVAMFEQKDYFIEFEGVESIRFNKAYFENVKIVTYKYNRTYPAVNASFTAAIDLGNTPQIIIQAYTFMSNEYRLFPLHMGVNFCDTVNSNDFGLRNIYKLGNFSGCPIKKGSYWIHNWAPDQSRFPPFIPNGRYMLDLQIVSSSSEEMAFLRAYGGVTRPLGRRH